MEQKNSAGTARPSLSVQAAMASNDEDQIQMALTENKKDMFEYEQKTKVDKKAVPGGKMMPGQKGRPLGIVSYSKLPQFRDSKGEPIPEFKVAPLGVLDPKIARPQFNK